MTMGKRTYGSKGGRPSKKGAKPKGMSRGKRGGKK